MQVCTRLECGYIGAGSVPTQGSFGVTLIPLLIGIGMLFYNGKSVLGWFLAGAGALVIFAWCQQVHFRATSLFNTLVMLALIMAGLGVMSSG